MPRCTLLPLPDHQVGFRVEGTERLRWHHGPQYPRPFFYPLLGPASGESLTRMGHPGAPDHDHHRSIWFAHEKVSGVNFWSDRTPARVRRAEPLTLRYLLRAHRGKLDPKRVAEAFNKFAKRSTFEVVKAPAKHTAFVVKRG